MSRSSELHKDELFLAWCDKTASEAFSRGFSMGAEFEREWLAAKAAGRPLPNESPILEAANYTRSVAFAIIAKDIRESAPAPAGEGVS